MKNQAIYVRVKHYRKKQTNKRNMTKINPAEIGFDIDGVLADTTEAFLRIARDNYHLSNIKESDITEFDVAKCLPIPANIVEEIFDILLEDPIAANMKPMPHAAEVLSKISAKNPITFITARPLAEPINAWLQHILPLPIFKNTRLIATGEHDGKIPHIKRHKLRFFVDDRTETCLNIKKAGITPFVFTQPWNIGRHNLLTVTDWCCIEKILDLT